MGITDPDGVLKLVVDETTGEQWIFEGETEPSPCADCGTNTTPHDEDDDLIDGAQELYMVTDQVWAQATGTHDARYLCIGCLEARIGRPLTPADFPPDIPINGPRTLNTDRLDDRLGHVKA